MKRRLRIVSMELEGSGLGEIEYCALKPQSNAVEPSDNERVLPLFPLSLVVQPGSSLPLHIECNSANYFFFLSFEMRYRLLFNQIKDKDRFFGIVLYNKDNNSIARVGCVMELIRFEPLPDGRILTVNTGKYRFRVKRILQDKPYVSAVVQTLEDFCCDDEVFSMELEVWNLLNEVLSLSNKLHGKNVQLSERLRRLSPDEQDRSPDRIVAFSHGVSQILDIPVKEQQLLLQTQSTMERFRHQLGMLQHAKKFLAAQVAINDALDKKSF
eukprot:jgi/Galph1/2676/GphlegSOOS_G1359.1